MLSVEEAIARLLQQAYPIDGTESLSLEDAHLRLLAEDCRAAVDVPPADNSAMDGYACHLAETAPAGLTLPITQTAAAGSAPQPLQPGTAARIFTGAEIPPGANCVIMQENCAVADGVITTRASLSPGDNVRPRGQDIVRGSLIARRGEQLSPALAGVLASTGMGRVQVQRRVRVALLNTGSELVQPGCPLQPGQIYNSNQATLAALLRMLSCEVSCQQLVTDRLDTTCAALLTAAQAADLVITSGGVSVGDEDHVKQALESVGRIDFHKICLKPGKPLAFGQIRMPDREVPVLGLPGNPVSAFITLLLFGKPFIEALQGRVPVSPRAIHLPCDFALPQPRSRPEYLRVRVEGSRLQRFNNQSSAVLTSLTWADGLALLPAGGPLAENTLLAYYPLAELMSLGRLP